VISVKSVLNESSFRIKIVQNDICIGFVRGSENYDLVIFIGLLETFDCIWSDVDASLDSFSVWESNIYDLITWIIFNVIDTMYKSFI